MGLSTAERNRRKRERKKKEKEERRKAEEAATTANGGSDGNPTDGVGANAAATNPNVEVDVEIEYVAEPLSSLMSTMASDSADGEDKDDNKDDGVPDGLPPGMKDDKGGDENENNMESVLRRFYQRAAVAAVVVSDEEKGRDKNNQDDTDDEYDDDDDDDDDSKQPLSKRKWREMNRPSVAELKKRVDRPDLVEAHDITANDPEFLITLKSIPGTVPVPRHWGRKRKYLQGKRGFEKPPFKLPDFIVKTGITEIRDTVAEDEGNMSAKQRNRGRVAPKMGQMDVDYKTLYDAFFRHQTKPTDLTKIGDLYFEGKELETNASSRKPGGPLSKALREALGMPPLSNTVPDTAPPPWLVNMQRYGPPPNYPNLSIPGLNAPLPNDKCQYGYHAGGWGKPPVDAYGRPLYGGNPFAPPGSGKQEAIASAFVTSDGKTIKKQEWGGLPIADFMVGGEDEDDEEEVSSSEEEDSDAMEESDADDDEVVVVGGTAGSAADGMDSVLPPPAHALAAATAPGDLRKQQAGDETPLSLAPPKQLYQVLEQTRTGDADAGKVAVFSSEVQYVVPGTNVTTEPSASKVPEGAESVLSKAMAPSESAKRQRRHEGDDEDEDALENFKF